MSPLTIDARREALERVEEREYRRGTGLLDSEERGLIANLWRI